MEQIYTIKEAAQILRVNTNYIYREIGEGKIKAIKIGSLKILESELLRYKENSTQNLDLLIVGRRKKQVRKP